MRHLRLGGLCLMLMIAIVMPSLYGDEHEENRPDTPNRERNIGDLICGPKCVREVLRLYGREDEDMIRLVREIQWPEVRKGSTMADIAQALEKRGVHTFAMKIKPSARIVWPHPVVVHLAPKPGEEIGHFVVWLPESQGGAAKVWNTDKGLEQQNERTWSKERSGAVLLTSLEPIDDPGKALKWVGLPFYDQGETVLAWGIFLVGLGLTIESFRFHQLYRKRKMS